MRRVADRFARSGTTHYFELGFRPGSGGQRLRASRSVIFGVLPARVYEIAEGLALRS